MPKKLKFVKMQGCGNDYIYFDCFEQQIDDPEALAAIIGNAITEKADAAFAGMRAVAGGQADAAGDEYEEDDEEDIPTIE